MMSKSYEVMTRVQQLQSIESKRILVGGEGVFASLQGGSPPQGFIKQASRDASGGIMAGFQKNPQKVHVYVDPRLFDVSKARFALTLDGYLGWGYRHRKGTVVVVGGIESDDVTHVEILVFENGTLVELSDRELPERSSTYFRSAATAVIGDLRAAYPSAKFVMAAPLTDWQMEGVEYIGDKPLRRLAFRPLSKTVNNKLEYLLPFGIAAAGVVFYGVAVSKGWNNYSRAVAAYEVAAADPALRKQGGMDTAYLDTMQQRRLFMEAPRRQELLSEKTAEFVRGIGAVQNVKIVELKLPAPSINPQPNAGIIVTPESLTARQKGNVEGTPDVWMQIAVPKTADTSIDQARSVMAIIANQTGMSLRLAHQGWKDDKDSRIFTIEGFIHG